MKQRFADIQVLRAFAIVLVIAYHIPFYLITSQEPSLLRFAAYFGGNAGVDLFLVISGFVIARSVQEKLHSSPTPGFALFEFWTRRFFRIIPAAWFWLLAILLLAIFFNQSGAFGSVRAAVEGSLAAMLQAANIRLAECQGHFDCGATWYYWSLSLQIQLYLLLPILAVFAGRRLALVLLLFVLSQCLTPWLMLPEQLRMSGFALGALLACLAPTITYRSLEPVLFEQLPWARRVVLAFLLLGLAGATAQGMHIVSGQLGFNLLALLSAALVFIASFDRQYILRDGWLKQILIRIGNRSYALYLTHIPAFFATRELLHRFVPDLANGPAAMLAYLGCAFVLTFAFSEFSYRLIEIPIQRRGLQWLKVRKQQEFPPTDGINHAQQTT